MRRHDDAAALETTGQARPVERAEDHALEAAAMATGRTDAVSPASVLHLQRAAGNAALGSVLGQDEEERSPVLDVVGKGGGSALDDDTRGFMESSLGHDFSDVRIHTDAKAAESATAVQAAAYTVGNDVVFQPERYSPSSDEGRRTIAHELTHVVQQRSGEVDGTPQGDGIKVSTPSDRFEQQAETTADAVMSGGPEQAPTSAPAGVQTTPVQREGEEEEELQTLPLQREAEEEEEAVSA